MPELNEVVSEAATSEVKSVPTIIPAETETTTAAAAAVVDAAVVEKKKPVKKAVKKTDEDKEKAAAEKAKVAEEKEKAKAKAAEEKAKAKAEKEKAKEKAKAEKAAKSEKEVEFVRPPMEQLTRDFETLLEEQEFDGKKLTKLGYKCGKIIWGLENSDGKDFRIIAYKARKKSKSVSGKSRCIFYFGVNQEDAKAFTKQHPEAKISVFGKCAVQSQTPVELIVDKVTYTEQFEKNVDKVMAMLKKLTHAAVHSKKEQYKLLKEKTEAKAEKKTKKEKKD